MVIRQRFAPLQDVEKAVQRRTHRWAFAVRGNKSDILTWIPFLIKIFLLNLYGRIFRWERKRRRRRGTCNIELFCTYSKGFTREYWDICQTISPSGFLADLGENWRHHGAWSLISMVYLLQRRRSSTYKKRGNNFWGFDFNFMLLKQCFKWNLMAH